MVFQSTLEKTEKMERLEVRTNGCTIVDIKLNSSYMTLFVYVSRGMNVSAKREDNKMVMGHNKHNDQMKYNKKSGVQIGDESENREQ